MRQREGGWSSLYIAGDLIRGHTETIILARLMQRDSYGYEINKTVRELSGGRLVMGPGTLYGVLSRMSRVQAVGGDRADHVLLGQRGYGRPAALLSHHPGRTHGLPGTGQRLGGHKRDH